jgi:hypothetical protein
MPLDWTDYPDDGLAPDRTARRMVIASLIVGLGLTAGYVTRVVTREPDRFCTVAMDAIRHGVVVPVHPSRPPDSPWCHELRK